MNNNTVTTQKKSKILFQHSIKMKIIALVVICIVATAALNLILNVPMIKSDITGLTKNYMKDMAVISGMNLDNSLAHADASEVLSTEQLKAAVGDVSVEGLETSYAYVVSSDGTMLYHPTAEKIGQPVENDAVKQLLSEIKKGNRPETDVIIYQFKGVTKYASYYIGQNLDYIVIVTADEAEAFASVNKIIMVNILSAIGALILFSIIGYLVAIYIVKPIESVTEEVERLANLDFRTNTKNERALNQKDEAGVMTRAVAELQKKLIEVVGGMKEQSQQLFKTSEDVRNNAVETKRTMDQVDRAIGEVAEGATSQAEETQTASENIIFMGSMIEETKNEVEALRDNAKDMHISGEKALNILEELSAINQKTKSAINIISAQTNQTNQSAMEIQSAIDIITDIAEETNLLSLNASIEAARAGEQGRGFAVVASQIQKLAEQSNESANHIEKIIELLINDSEKTVETMKEVNEVVERQDEDVRKTADAFDRVKAGIASSIEGIDHIAEKTERLDDARVKVVDVVQNLTAIAEENAASTEETSASATAVGEVMTKIADNTSKLNDIANGMEESVNQFIME